MPKIFSVPRLLAALCVGSAAAPARADNFKVDIDAAFPARSDTTAPGFTQWALTGDLTADKRLATHTFTTSAGTYTCTIRQSAPTAADPTLYLNANWLNKNGIAGGYLLSFDGVWVHQKDDSKSFDRPYPGGGALELTITGLSTGAHTITTYHNNIWGSAYGTISRCRITVAGATVATVTPSPQVTNDNDCAAAFFTVNAVAGQPLVIAFSPDGSGALDDVILNGFEIDRAAPPGAVATAPVPANGDEHVFANNDEPLPGTEGQGSTTLTWTPATSAISHDVYFGTDRAAVTAATRSSPLFRGNQAAATLAVSRLSSAATYYWRVDEITSAGTSFKGEVWNFRVRHLAFPGAEGYGRFARGGRGGRVIEVTNLLDYDTSAGDAVIPGSYRAAIEATGPRSVVFRVSGLIHLKKPCTVGADNSYLTIAAQTAPGEGICLADSSAGLGSCTDIIMRFLRDRVGDASRTAIDGIGMGSSNDSIIDHCTISWAIDEGTSSRDGHNITFQRNIVSEGLQHSYHYAAADRTKYETHAFAGSISGQIGSYHHNLLAHCTDRNWSLAGGLTQDGKYAGYLDLRNNVVYNWTARTTDGGVKACNFVNNYYKPGPAGGVKWFLRPDAGSATDRQQYYVTGNVLEGYVTESTNWSAGIAYLSGVTEADIRVNAPFFPDYVTTHTAREAYKLVLSDVGANQPQADVIDRRIVQEVRTGTSHYIGTLSTNYPNGIKQPPEQNYPGIIDQPTDVKDTVGSPNFPWPAYATYSVPTDTDHDGLPDYWELAIGSDPKVASNNDDPDHDGYTLLEDYLNWLAAPHAVTRTDTAVDLDLLPIAAGFTKATFAVKTSTLGTAVLQADGRTVRFTPDAGVKGRGGFTFTATDADGIALTGTYGICITPQSPVYDSAGDARISNLSVRAVSRGRDTPLIVGFFISGGSKPLLIRAIGPGLSQFGVSSVLADPLLEIHATVANQDAVVASNDNWGDGDITGLRQSFAANGAFALTDPASKDAALLATLGGGNSALVFDPANRSGVTLIELYDIAPTGAPRLFNASVRNLVSTGDGVLIAGFVVTGTVPRRLLVRAIGPTLATFGVTGVLADPRLELVSDSGQTIANNDNWGDGDITPLRQAFTNAGAFNLSDTASKDAVLVVTLPPGVYSAVVRGVGGTIGEALLELYEIP